MLRLVRWAALFVAAVALVIATWLVLHSRQGPVVPENIGGVVSAVEIGGPFELVEHTGRTVTDADFRGRWMLIYFGYTYCPDVCPTELANMAVALDMLGDAAARVVPMLITVDPGRDTPAVLAEYVPLFGERIVGLTGARAQIDAAMKAYRVYAARTESPAHTDYLMDHSSYVYLMGSDGKFVAMFRYRTDPAEIATTIRRHMASR
ncbi:MAG: SCO family protein [Alphaproteobacteria bacterium]|nr:SCO family protein [Alphaproteobacteria bacterium]